MAWFCHFWQMTPDQYRRLTIGEHRAFVHVMKRIDAKRKKGR